MEEKGGEESSLPTDTVEDTETNNHQESSVDSAAPVQQDPKVGDAQLRAAASFSYGDHGNEANSNREFVETSTFESVKAVVNRFGGSAEWKTHRTLSLQRTRIPDHEENSSFDHELVKVHREISTYKKRSEAAEKAKQQALKELESTKRLTEDLNLKLEIEQGTDDASNGTRIETVSESKEKRKTVEELTLELVTIRQSLATAQSVHRDAQERSIGAALAKDQDCLTWERELKQADEEVQQLKNQILTGKELESKLTTASSSLLELKAELKAYMEARSTQETQEAGQVENGADEAKRTHKYIQEAIDTARQELGVVKKNVGKAQDEVNSLQSAASSLKLELDTEKTDLATLRQREGMASIVLSSLEADIERMSKELEIVRAKEKEAMEKMVEIPKKLRQASEEAEQAKFAAQSAQEELRKAKDEAELAMASSSTAQIRLTAILKEMEAAKVSERLAIAAVKALHESEQSASDDGGGEKVSLPFAEYFSLAKRAHEAEDVADQRVAAVTSQVELAKESESCSTRRLHEAYKQMEGKKHALSIALEKAEKAKEGKLAMEQELRQWRAESENRRRSGDLSKAATENSMSSLGTRSFDKDESDSVVHPLPGPAPLPDPVQLTAPLPDPAPLNTPAASNLAVSVSEPKPQQKKMKKKNKFFRRIMSLLARKRIQSQR